MTKRIVILGDFNPAYPTQHALNDSVRHVLKKFDEEIQFDWVGSDVLNYKTAFDKLYCGLWIAPGSPYKDMENVLDTISFTRQNNIPTFGNCGGFQHMVIEYARNVCGISHADHEETDPGSKDLVISKLACSLVGQEENLTIVDKHSKLFNIIKKEQLLGKYFCNYGINSKYLDALKSNGFKTTVVSEDGQVRAFEIADHRFFIGSLFQPALTSTKKEPNPLIVEFVKESISWQ
ncbi:MAG: CTP synthase [Bacteroidales bacterium]|nr:CTP synthase [Bacteroidales bacterium]